VKVEVKEISQVVKELTLTVEAEKVNKDYKKALQKVSKMAPPIPGFRKGKAPLSAVEKNYGEYIKEELYKDFFDKYL
jgi:trigger factor